MGVIVGRLRPPPTSNAHLPSTKLLLCLRRRGTVYFIIIYCCNRYCHRQNVNYTENISSHFNVIKQRNTNGKIFIAMRTSNITLKHFYKKQQTLRKKETSHCFRKRMTLTLTKSTITRLGF